MQQFHLVTAANKSARFYPWLLASCERHGISLVTLGWGEPWRGLLSKFYLVLAYIQPLPDTDIVCFVDAYDVIILRDAAEIVRRFKAAGTGAVFSMDAKFGDIFMSFTGYWTCADKNINTGTYIGYVGAVKQLLGSVCKELQGCNMEGNDQNEFIRVCRKSMQPFYDIMKVDEAQNIFLVQTYQNKLMSSVKAVDACILHCPGDVNMFPAIKMLGYSVTAKEEADVTASLHKNVFARLRERRWMIAATVAIVLLISAWTWHVFLQLK